MPPSTRSFQVGDDPRGEQQPLQGQQISQAGVRIAIKDRKSAAARLTNDVRSNRFQPLQMPKNGLVGESLPDPTIATVIALVSVVIAPTHTTGNQGIKHLCSDMYHRAPPFTS